MTDNSQRPTNQTYFLLFQEDLKGQAVLAELARLFYDSPIFDNDPCRTAFNAGKREVISYLMKRCRVLDTTAGENNE